MKLKGNKNWIRQQEENIMRERIIEEKVRLLKMMIQSDVMHMISITVNGGANHTRDELTGILEGRNALPDLIWLKSGEDM